MLNVISEMQIKTTTRFNITHITMATIKKTIRRWQVSVKVRRNWVPQHWVSQHAAVTAENSVQASEKIKTRTAT